MRFTATLILIGLAGTMPGAAWPADRSAGPTVVIEPGDVTPLRGNIRNPLGPSQVYAPLRPLPAPSLDVLERDLDRLGSRSGGPRLGLDPRAPPRDLIEQPRGRPAPPAPREAIDRERARAALEAFRTLRPNAAATPGLERALDRLERSTDLGR